MITKPIPYGRQHITDEDIQCVIDALKSDYLTQGPKIKEFEEAFASYVGCKYAIAVNNATAGLHLAATVLDVNLGDMQKRISEETHHALTELSTNAGYPITETLSGSGDLGQVLVDAIKKYDMDLVVCGHHQDFWSKLMSSARQLINTVHVDMLIVPLRDEEE